jgi:single-stranded-DNA-specific exonuclease
MISISNNNWEEKKNNKNTVEKIKQSFNFSEIISKLIISRNYDNEEIYSINNEVDLTNVFLNNIDFDNSANIVINSIKNKEKICIVGDYDVDGSAATSLLIKFFDNIKHPFFFYIPDREKDGYGATKKIFKKIILEKPKLVIMVDCGSTSIEAINYLNKNGIKSIIIDHHEINKPYPLSNSIINPKKGNGYKEYDYFCATALTYFFIDILIKKTNSKLIIQDFIIYVLLATVCDVMPIRKLNRIIAKQALLKFDVSKILPFNEIYQLSNKNNKISINDLGFFIGPILNAGGRLGKSNYATELLSSTNSTIINERTIELIKLNEKRKKIEDKILQEIDFYQIEKDNKNIIFIYKPNINEGLIGIIAARLKDYFNKPVIVITNSNNILKASARSIYEFNIGSAIKNAVDLKIIINGGGHGMAAGFTLEKKMLNNFKTFITKSFDKLNIVNNKYFNYDAKISSIAFNKDFYQDIKKLEPFGNGNIEPIFLFDDLRIIKSNVIKNKHISSILKSKVGYSINSISFNSVNTKIGEYLLNYKKELKVIGQIKENFWNNKNSLQLIVKDLII